jgi:hypothetical protein
MLHTSISHVCLKGPKERWRKVEMAIYCYEYVGGVSGYDQFGESDFVIYQQDRPWPLYLVRIECSVLVRCWKRDQTNSISQGSIDMMEVLERIMSVPKQGFPMSQLELYCTSDFAR